jgi:hypothetical protein
MAVSLADRTYVPCAAPAPVLDVLAKACAYRVFEDVPAGGSEVVFVVDDPRREPVAEEVTRSTVTPVEPLRVDAVQALYTRGEPVARGLQDDVIVVPIRQKAYVRQRKRATTSAKRRRNEMRSTSSR